jgi:NAD(P)-dependent dehydrogenase (short-subunit alcohol dehydrogenase family)
MHGRGEAFPMKIRDSVAFVTGANRGLGLAFVQELLAVGAWKVYAAARDPKGITLPGAIPISLDVTKPESVAAATRAFTDVNLLINNAGICHWSGIYLNYDPARDLETAA